MIRVTRLNQSELYINADLIEFIESTPDTVITTITGRKLLVRETPDELRSRIIAYRRESGAARFPLVSPDSHSFENSQDSRSGQRVHFAEGEF